MNVPGNGERDLAKFATAIRDLASGGSNALGGPVTLAPDTTETVVTDARCAPGAVIVPFPTTASAAEARLWLQASRRGSFIWGHDASPAGDRSFRYEIRRP